MFLFYAFWFDQFSLISKANHGHEGSSQCSLMYFMPSCKWLKFTLNTNSRIYYRSSEESFEAFRGKSLYCLLQRLWDICLQLTMRWRLHLSVPKDVGWIMNPCIETTQSYSVSIAFQAGEVMWETSSFFQKKSYLDAQTFWNLWQDLPTLTANCPRASRVSVSLGRRWAGCCTQAKQKGRGFANSLYRCDICIALVVPILCLEMFQFINYKCCVLLYRSQEDDRW